MDKNTYYKIREDIGISNKITQFIDTLNNIMEIYPHTQSMTVQETKDWLWDRYIEWESKIQQILNVK